MSREGLLDEEDLSLFGGGTEIPLPPADFDDHVQGWPSSTATSIVNPPDTLPSDEEDTGPDGFGPINTSTLDVEPANASPDLFIDSNTVNRLNQVWVHQFQRSAMFPTSQLQYPWEKIFTKTNV